MALDVAVIGAGAAGLVTARELMRAGNRVRIFERGGSVGGLWVYAAEAESDPLGQTGARVHSSLYASLRTNLPRDLMAFVDYPFDSTGGGRDDWPRFPGHRCVRAYLEAFARDFGVREHVTFAAEVKRLAPDPEGGWVLGMSGGSGERVFHFDAVAVCSGHYAAPRVPTLPGADEFPGSQRHSHNYREPSPYRNRSVALLGTAASGVDLSREIATVAERVLWCGEAFDSLPAASREAGNLVRLPLVEALRADGRLQLRGGTVTDPVDDLVYCTGYHYRYPFLDAALITIEDNWVQPLYRDLLHIEHPTLAFIGVPFRVVPFPMFEMQARWFARLLGGGFRLPDAATMRAHTAAVIEGLRARGVRQRHFHQLTIDCFPYLDALAAECGVAPSPDWQRQLAAAFLAEAQRHPGAVRDHPLPHFGPTRVPPESIAKSVP